MELLCLDQDALARALSMPEAMASARLAFRGLADGTAAAPPRCVLSAPAPRGTTLVMGGAVKGEGLAAKVVTVNPSNPAEGLPGTMGLVVVLDPVTGQPRALCDGTWLTAWRTGAATGAATDALARSDARVGLVVGAGTQARAQVLGIDAARGLESIQVWARRRERAADLAARLEGLTRAPVTVAEDLETAARAADVIATATSATDPVIRGAWLSPGVHISAVGSFRPQMAELDVDAVARARVFVDTVDGALEEAGELIQAEAAGRTSRAQWTPLGAVLSAAAEGRRSSSDITFFKSVGNAAQDVTAAAAALTRARELGLGTTVRL